MTSLYHGALLFRVHLAGEELRLTSDYQLSRFFPLPAFPSPLWRVLAERVAHPIRTTMIYEYAPRLYTQLLLYCPAYRVLDRLSPPHSSVPLVSFARRQDPLRVLPKIS